MFVGAEKDSGLRGRDDVQSGWHFDGGCEGACSEGVACDQLMRRRMGMICWRMKRKSEKHGGQPQFDDRPTAWRHMVWRMIPDLFTKVCTVQFCEWS